MQSDRSFHSLTTYMVSTLAVALFASSAWPQTMSCQLRSDTALPSGSVTLDMFIDSVTDLRGYQTAIAITRTSGAGDVTVPCPGGIVIDEVRSDYVFLGAGSTFGIDDCPALELAQTLFSGGVNVGATPEYLVEYTLDVSSDATAGSTFEISITGNSNLSDSVGNAIAFSVSAPCVLTVACSVPADCDDADVCTGVEDCVGGFCVGGTPLDCDDLVACTDDSCDAVAGCDNVDNCTGGQTCNLTTGVCEGGCTSDGDCLDADVCNGAETCDLGTNVCQPGTALDCDDLVACTDDSCDSVSGCQNIDNCTGVQTCNLTTGLCEGGCTSDGDCVDADVCNGAETCDLGTNVCQSGTALDCDDLVACTDDSCDSVAGCQNVDNCTAGQVCNLTTGVCEGAQLTLVATGSAWRYLDDGSDQGTAWSGTAFVDTGWASGDAELGYGDGTEVTVVSAGCTPVSSCGPKFVTTYFRHTFNVVSAAAVTSLTLNLQRDDGAIVYLNDTEVRRDNLPAGAVDFLTLALDPPVAGADETTFFTSSVDPLLLVDGPNVLAVEIHQQSLTSSDISFDLELVGQGGAVCTGPGDCDDGDVCTTDDCVSDTCVNTPIAGCCVADGDCDDGNVCTTDTCDLGTNTCSNVNNNAPCDDGDACTDSDACAGGVCSGGGAVDCDDSIACTDDSCDSIAGCQNTNNCPAGESCNLTTGICESISVDPLPIVEGDDWRYFKGTVSPPVAWNTAAFDDSSWLVGPSGIGYETGTGYAGCIATDLADMPDNYISVFARRTFSISNPAEVLSLSFAIDFDDGYIAYLNGVEVANEFGPIPPSFDLPATTPNHEACCGTGTPTGPCPPPVIDLSSFIGDLVAGTNVLAIQVHNRTIDSSDFLFVPELSATFGAPALMTCQLDSPSAAPNSTVPLDVFVQEVNDARGYQTTIAITRTSGSGTVSVNCPGGVEIDELRSDYIFLGAGSTFGTPSCPDLRAVNALLSGGVTVGLTPAYLSGYALTVSSDAGVGSTFEIEILGPLDSNLSDSVGNPISFAIGAPCVLTVGGCVDDGDCIDADVCNGNETCDAGTCIAGTPPDCDDGVSCTDDSCDSFFGCQNLSNCPAGEVCDLGAGTCVPQVVRARIELVALDTPTVSDTVVVLPTSRTSYLPAETFFLEVWAQTPVSEGLQSVSVDIPFDAAVLNAVNVVHSSLFDDQFVNGSIDNVAGLIDDLSGTHGLTIPSCADQVGLEPNWARLATIEMLAMAGGASVLQSGDTGDEFWGTTICDAFGNEDPINIVYGQLPVRVVECFDSSECDDADLCTTDACDLVTNLCVYTPIDVATICDDSDACTVDTCDPPTGNCVNTPVDPGVACDDSNFCTTDTCAAATGCVNTPIDVATACDDSDLCTADTCTPAIGCVNTTIDPLVVCDDGDLCTVETCEAAVGCLNTPIDPAVVCDDSNNCTVDTCEALTGCVNTLLPNCTPCELDAECVDGVACTLDTCSPTGCANTPDDSVCDNSIFCDGAESCDPVAGCQPGADPCPLLECDEVLDACIGCLFQSDCDDGAFCNGAESCVDNICEPGIPPVVDDGIACTVDSCDEVNDVVVNAPDDAACDNGSFCDGAEVCDPIAGCLPGTPLDLDDGVNCTVDSCDEALDEIVHTPDPSVCSNGVFCDGAEVCDPIAGCQVAAPLDCDDSIQCTLDSCDELNARCLNIPDHALCSDDLVYCNGQETCEPGLGCVLSGPPCGDVCEQCNEDDALCDWCLFDLNLNSTVDGLDFGFFSGCFGACYVDGEPCFETNFDLSVDGCVGGGDFAGFSGCFGVGCGACTNCWGPAAAGATAAVDTMAAASVRLVAVEAPSTEEIATALPRGKSWFQVGKVFYVEVWAQVNHGGGIVGDGMASAYVDLTFDAHMLTVESIYPSQLFPNFRDAVLDNGQVRVLGGCTVPGDGDLGAASEWVRVALLKVRSMRRGAAAIDILPAAAPYGVSIFGQFGDLAPWQIELSGTSVTLTDGVKPGVRPRRSR